MEVSAQAAQIFDIAALVEYTRFPEQPGPEYATLIQQVRHWVCILMEAGGMSGAGEGKAGMCKVGLMKHFLLMVDIHSNSKQNQHHIQTLLLWAGLLQISVN